MKILDLDHLSSPANDLSPQLIQGGSDARRLFSRYPSYRGGRTSATAQAYALALGLHTYTLSTAVTQTTPHYAFSSSHSSSSSRG